MVALARYESETRTPVEERRIFSRAKVEMKAEARRLDHSIPALRMPRLTLEVRDISVNGMSAHSDTPVEHGEHVGVFFPAQSGSRGWGAFGRVVRCQPSATGYRVAVEFDPLPAA